MTLRKRLIIVGAFGFRLLYVSNLLDLAFSNNRQPRPHYCRSPPLPLS